TLALSGTDKPEYGLLSTASSLCATPEGGLFQRNLDHPKMDGVSTNLALIFGTLLSSQGADASFVLTLSGFPPGASFVLAFPTLSDLSDPISSVLSGPELVSRGLPALPTLSVPFGPDSQSVGVAFAAVGPFRRVRL
ncbi:hypothetical protein, partial [Streptomyces showdoensis]|uniref:hypothetical protein n=1 Tax=Streptomyces showdoensis TaxID=68268 RepID=UPI00196A10B0